MLQNLPVSVLIPKLDLAFVLPFKDLIPAQGTPLPLLQESKSGLSVTGLHKPSQSEDETILQILSHLIIKITFFDQKFSLKSYFFMISGYCLYVIDITTFYMGFLIYGFISQVDKYIDLSV